MAAAVYIFCWSLSLSFWVSQARKKRKQHYAKFHGIEDLLKCMQYHCKHAIHSDQFFENQVKREVMSSYPDDRRAL